VKTFFANRARDAKASPGFFVAADVRRSLASTSVVVAINLLLRNGALAEVERIEVIGERTGHAEQQAPTAFVTVIDLDERVLEFETVADVLAESTGIHVRRFGGLGSFSTISIRGSDSNQVQFYIDGVPISRAQNETVDLSTLPLDGLRQIEVYRGTIPVGFGGGGTGGVVNLITRTPSETPETEVTVGYGSYQSRKVNVSHSRRLGDFAVLGNVTYTGTEGDFSFDSDGGTPQNPDDDGREKRENNDSNTVDVLLKVSHPLGSSASIGLTQEFLYDTGGVPGQDSPQALETELEEIRSLTYLRIEADSWPFLSTDLEAGLFGIYYQQDFDDPLGEFGVVQDTRNRTGTVGGNFSLHLPDLPYQSLTNFIEVSYDIFAPHNGTNDPPDGPDQERIRISLSAQDEISFLDRRILIVPTLRYQHVRDELSEADNLGRPEGGTNGKNYDLFNPSIGAAVRVQDWLTIRGNIGRFERVPNFSELFGNTGTVRPNPDLDPETAINRDIGFVLSTDEIPYLDRLHLEYVYFNNDIDDLISFRQIRADLFEARNFDDARIRGHEVSFDLVAAGHLGVTVNYTNQDATNLSRAPSEYGKQLPLTPNDELFMRSEIFDEERRLYYEYNFIGDSYTGPSNLRRIDSRDLHTLGVAWQPLDWLGLSFETRNLTDSDVRDLFDFPLPGRTFLGKVSTKF
jgi:outer membrane cobalamin receptor